MLEPNSLDTPQSSKPSKVETEVKSQPSLSVIVPTYRRPDEVIRCLKALENQNRLPDQVVVTVRPDDTASLESLYNF